MMGDFLEKRKSAKLKNKVFQVLVDRAPNPVRLETVERVLEDVSTDDIVESFSLLEEEGLVSHQTRENNFVPGREFHIFSLKNPHNYPAKQTFTIGGVEFTRWMQADMMGPEDFMEGFEALDAYAKDLEKRFEELTSKMTRRYWANMAALFALFISVFALIIRASDPILVEAPYDFQALFLLKLSEIGPLAIILFLFSLFLWLILRRF